MLYQIPPIFSQILMHAHTIYDEDAHAIYDDDDGKITEQNFCHSAVHFDHRCAQLSESLDTEKYNLTTIITIIDITIIFCSQ